MRTLFDDVDAVSSHVWAWHAGWETTLQGSWTTICFLREDHHHHRRRRRHHHHHQQQQQQQQQQQPQPHWLSKQLNLFLNFKAQLDESLPKAEVEPKLRQIEEGEIHQGWYPVGMIWGDDIPTKRNYSLPTPRKSNVDTKDDGL